MEALKMIFYAFGGIGLLWLAWTLVAFVIQNIALLFRKPNNPKELRKQISAAEKEVAEAQKQFNAAEKRIKELRQRLEDEEDLD